MVIASVLLYFIGWIFYYIRVINLLIILLLIISPCVAFIFFAIDRKNVIVLYLRKFRSMEEFRIELERYIDYYNNKRIKGKLKGLSPVGYKLQSSLVT